MEIKTYTVGQLQTNCYFVINNKQCLIIDPGDEADFLLEKISQLQLQPLALLATHGHFDHLMAVGEIQKSWAIPLYLDRRDWFLLKRLNSTAVYFLGYDPGCLPPSQVYDLKTNQLKIADFEFEIIDTPGHTPGGCSFYSQKDQVIFSGDIIFKNGIGRYDFSYSNKTDLDASISTLLNLPKKTVIYPGHTDKLIVADVHF